MHASLEEEQPASSSHSDLAEDDLFYEALSIIVEQGQAATSLLQRRLMIGYKRASHIIHRFEAKGFVSGSKGALPRDVLVTAEDLEAMTKGANLQAT